MAGTLGIGGTIAKLTRVTLEMGPKGKKVVAVAPDWPGLERGAKTREDAIKRLRSYIPRYSQVAKLAEMDAEFDTIKNVDVVEQYPGTGSTDFWGISFAFSSIDKQGMSGDELERELTLMQACWAFFDDVRRRVSAEMQKGPRGEDDRCAHPRRCDADWQGAESASRCLLPRHTGLSLTGQVGRQDGEMAAPVPDSAHRLSHHGPRLGNGRQGPDDLTVKQA